MIIFNQLNMRSTFMPPRYAIAAAAARRCRIQSLRAASMTINITGIATTLMADQPALTANAPETPAAKAVAP